MTFFYMLLALIAGLLLGWFLWGRLRGEINDLRGDLNNTRNERDRLKTDINRLSGELEACGTARADLGRQLREAKAESSSAALISAPVTAASPSLAAPAKPAAKPAKTRAAKSKTTLSVSSAGKDNLRRLIGIGPVNERRLNEHGITTFAQMAAWTAADILGVENYLQFDGRIERERWVEQAKLLAAGNEKEFARRFPTAGSSDNT